MLPPPEPPELLQQGRKLVNPFEQQPTLAKPPPELTKADVPAVWNIFAGSVRGLLAQKRALAPAAALNCAGPGLGAGRRLASGCRESAT